MAQATHDRYLNDEIFHAFQEMKRRAHPVAQPTFDDDWREDLPTIIDTSHRHVATSNRDDALGQESQWGFRDEDLAQFQHEPGSDLLSIAQSMVPASNQEPTFVSLPQGQDATSGSTSLAHRALCAMASVLAFLGFI